MYGDLLVVFGLGGVLHLRIPSLRELEDVLSILVVILLLRPLLNLLLHHHFLLEFDVHVELRLVEDLVVLLLVQFLQLFHRAASPVRERATKTLKKSIFPLAVQVAVREAFDFVDVQLVNRDSWLILLLLQLLSTLMRDLLEILYHEVARVASKNGNVVHLL